MQAEKPAKKFSKAQLSRITRALKPLVKEIEFLKTKPVLLKKSSKFILPDGIEIRIHIFENEHKMLSSIQVFNEDRSVQFGGNSIGMTWDKGRKNSEVQFTEAKLPSNVSGVYFDGKKFFYVKRFKRKGKAEKT